MAVGGTVGSEEGAGVGVVDGWGLGAVVGNEVGAVVGSAEGLPETATKHACSSSKASSSAALRSAAMIPREAAEPFRAFWPARSEKGTYHSKKPVSPLVVYEGALVPKIKTISMPAVEERN